MEPQNPLVQAQTATPQDVVHPQSESAAPSPVQPNRPDQPTSSPSHPSLVPQPSPLKAPDAKGVKHRWILLSGVILLIFLGGFGGTWMYYRFFSSNQLPSNLSSFMNVFPPKALSPSASTPDEKAIAAVKKAYPELRYIERGKDEGTKGSWIMPRLTASGDVKLQFHRGTGCTHDYPYPDDCQDEYNYYFIVTPQGSVVKVGEWEYHRDPSDPDNVRIVGTRLPDFLKEDE